MVFQHLDILGLSGPLSSIANRDKELHNRICSETNRAYRAALSFSTAIQYII